VAVLLNDVFCPACAGRHKLCLPDADNVYSNREYQYECPSAKRAVRLPKDEWGEVVAACPTDALTVQEVKS
jgi:hypothetical protein